MNNKREIFKSKRFIFLMSILIAAICRILSCMVPPEYYINFGMFLFPLLSLLWGPIAILGYCIVELIYLLMAYPENIFFNIAFAITIFLSGFTAWKLWYSSMNKNGTEIPNLRNFHNFFKFVIIFLAYLSITTVLLSILAIFPVHAIEFNIYVVLNFFSMIIPFSFFLTIFSLYIVNSFKIPLYSPKKQIKQIMPKKIYNVFLVFSLAIGIYITLSSLAREYFIISLEPFAISAASNGQSYLLGFLAILFLIIYLLKPYDSVSLIKSEIKISLFNKMHMFLFLIVALIILAMSTLEFLLDHNIINAIYIIISYAFAYFIVMLIPILVILFLLERNLIMPINRLSEIVSRKVSSKEEYLEHKKNLNSIKVNNEIKTLIDSLQRMEKDLINYGENLIRVTSEKERYETELKLGSEIQSSMVPKDFEEFSNCLNANDENEHCIELWGFVKSAREVGGDFYDYFKIDEGTVGFAVGDVCRKGIPTALMMVESMVLIQDYAKEYTDLSKAFHEVNNLIYEDNEEELFVQSLLGKLDLNTGEFSFVNAGYNPPLIRLNPENHYGSSMGFLENEGFDGDFEYMRDDKNPLLSHIRDADFETHSIKLYKGDAVFLYSDGIIKTSNGSNESYGKERLKNILNKHKDDDLNVIMESIEKDRAEFSKNEEQMDDITMFMIRLK